MDEILNALYKLVAPGEITEERVISLVASHPELLTSDAEFLARAIAGIQTSPGARNTMEQIATLLNRFRLLGVGPAIIEHRQNIARERSEKRFWQISEKTLKQRLESTGSIEEFCTPPIGSEKFESLSECVQFISVNYAPETIHVESGQVDGKVVDRKIPAEFPKYLFRGESGQYPKTTTSVYRVNSDVTLPLKAIEQILLTRSRLLRDLSEKYELGPLVAEGLLQHYGIPTDFLDVTASLDTAVSFATDLRVGQIGAICVLATQRLTELTSLVDLRGVPSAARPRRQEAFAVSCDRYYDYKNVKTVNELGLKWHWFRFTEADSYAFPPNPELLDAHTDRASGLIELLISGYGRIHDQAARWLANRLQPAPFACISLSGMTENEPARVAWVSAEEAGIPYEEKDRSDGNYERWSDKYSDPPIRALPKELLMQSTERIKPGSVIRIMSSRGLESLPREFLKVSGVDPLIRDS